MRSAPEARSRETRSVSLSRRLTAATRQWRAPAAEFSRIDAWILLASDLDVWARRQKADYQSAKSRLVNVLRTDPKSRRTAGAPVCIGRGRAQKMSEPGDLH